MDFTQLNRHVRLLISRNKTQYSKFKSNLFNRHFSLNSQSFLTNKQHYSHKFKNYRDFLLKDKIESLTLKKKLFIFKTKTSKIPKITQYNLSKQPNNRNNITRRTVLITLQRLLDCKKLLRRLFSGTIKIVLILRILKSIEETIMVWFRKRLKLQKQCLASVHQKMFFQLQIFFNLQIFFRLRMGIHLKIGSQLHPLCIIL